MDFNECKQFIEDNKESAEVKGYLDGFGSLDVFKGKLTTDATFKSFMDSEKDKHNLKALETWKTNNLKKLIDDEVAKKFPKADPKDLAVKELQDKLDKIEKESARKELTNKAMKIATDKKLPVNLIDYFVGNDEETTTGNLNAFEEFITKHDEALKTELLKGSYKPAGNFGGGGEGESIGQKLAAQRAENQKNSAASQKNYF